MKVRETASFCRLTFLIAVALLPALVPCGAICLAAPAYAATDNAVENGRALRSNGNAVKPVSDELDALSQRAEEIYGLARSNRWRAAERGLGVLKRSEEALGTLQNEESAALQPRLRKTVADLGEAVAARRRADAMRLANKITLIEAAMAEPFRPRTPTNVGLLDYYGRELEIWSEARDMDRLSYTVLRMHLTWQTLIPKLGPQSDIKVIKKFADLLRHLDGAKEPEEYARLAAQVHEEVDALEKSFRCELLRGKLPMGAK